MYSNKNIQNSTGELRGRSLNFDSSYQTSWKSWFHIYSGNTFSFSWGEILFIKTLYYGESQNQTCEFFCKCIDKDYQI